MGIGLKEVLHFSVRSLGVLLEVVREPRFSEGFVDVHGVGYPSFSSVGVFGGVGGGLRFNG